MNCSGPMGQSVQCSWDIEQPVQFCIQEFKCFDHVYLKGRTS